MSTPVGRVFCVVFAASLLAVAQLEARAGSLALVALVPWMVTLFRCGLVGALALSVLLGTSYGCMVALWIPEALRTLGSAWGFAATGLVVTATWAKAPLFAGLGLVVHRSAQWPLWRCVTAVGVGFFAAEWVVSTWRWGVPWALLGHSQLEVGGVAQLAVVGGVPAISALVAGVNVSVARWVAGSGSVRGVASLAAAFASLAVLGLPLAEAVRPGQSRGAPRDLLVVQPDIPRGERWGDALQPLDLERVSSFVARANDLPLSGVAAVVLPENLLTTPVDAAPELSRALQAWVDSLGVPVITGLAMASEVEDPSLYRSAVVWIEPHRGVTARIDKVRGVPVLESARRLPGQSLLAPLFGGASRWTKVEEAKRAGPLEGTFSVAAVLCYEALFPGLVAQRRSPESVAILNLADDGWVAGPDATRQLTAFARFRAIEQRLTLVRVAHGGLSVVVDPYGSVVEQLPLDTYATMRVPVRALPPPTLAERCAIVALPVGTGAGVWWMGSLLPQRRRKP